MNSHLAVKTPLCPGVALVGGACPFRSGGPTVCLTKRILIKVVRIDLEGGLSAHGGSSDLNLELSKYNPVAKNRFLTTATNSPSGVVGTKPVLFSDPPVLLKCENVPLSGRTQTLFTAFK